jgi:hypothetical protein
MPISLLEKWYAERCDGEWEHSWGVRIETLDNPGWSIKISLNKTQAQNRVLERKKVERSETDWMHYWVESEAFHIRCGPANLSEAITVFIDWFDQN